jgi:hypothetical protein
MKKLLTFLFIVLSLNGITQAQPPHKNGDDTKAPQAKFEGQRKYSLIICEGNDSTVKSFNRGLTEHRNIRSSSSDRGMISGLVSLYRFTLAGKVMSSSQSLIESGVSAIVGAARSKKPDWQKAVNNESQFIRVLPMHTEVLDFYSKPSTVGPLDPTDMYFNGFGCRQVIEYRLSNDNNNDNETSTSSQADSIQEVFYVSCKVRTDAYGYTRMLNHSKFEIYIDSLRFSPYLCDLPNDSLGVETDKRIDFSFENRKDLQFNVHVTITSSWINQAMQVLNDVTLGEFDIVAKIDPKKLNKEGVYVYSRHDDKDPDNNKNLTVQGECFLIPRSYVGTSDLSNNEDCWGTGQYKVEMRVAETCRIDDKYYETYPEAWKSEWKKIKSRKHKTSPFNQMLNIVGVEYIKDKTAWITTLVDPLKTYLIQTESGILKVAGSGNSTTQVNAQNQ